MAKKMKASTWLFLGAGALVLWGMTRPAVAAPLHPDEALPQPVEGESDSNYMKRLEAWSLQTGEMVPTLEGYGAQSLYGEASYPRTGGEWYRY